MTFTQTDNEISERFIRTGNNWLLCRYEYYGATNYTQLLKHPSRPGQYLLQVCEDSGYSDPFLVTVLNEREALRTIRGFPPTNSDFKTDRKQ